MSDARFVGTIFLERYGFTVKIDEVPEYMFSGTPATAIATAETVSYFRAINFLNATIINNNNNNDNQTNDIDSEIFIIENFLIIPEIPSGPKPSITLTSKNFHRNKPNFFEDFTNNVS